MIVYPIFGIIDFIKLRGKMICAKDFYHETEEKRTKMRFPDFIIAGAMKCGTTSLHNILSSHPEIYIPQREIHFFDIDDIKQHPDFFIFSNGNWYYPQYGTNFEKYLNWYRAFFSTAHGTQVIGEDSTTYLASAKTPERIAKLIPDVKIIIMLRDPASRTYSHYWHLLRTGRAIHTFEDSLRIMPGTLIQRSHYKNQIEKYLKHFSRENICFILFEEFIQDIQGTVNEVCQYLNVPNDGINIHQIKTHYNPANLPKFPTLQLWRNRLMKISTHPTYLEHLLDVPHEREYGSNNFAILMDRIHSKINSQKKGKPPQMNPITRKFLNQYFSQENNGLNELISKDIDALWYKDL